MNYLWLFQWFSLGYLPYFFRYYGSQGKTTHLYYMQEKKERKVHG